MIILTEGKTPSDIATRANLDAWIAKVPQPFTATLDSVDPQAGMESYFSVPRDQFLLIDLKTMKLIEIVAANPQRVVDDVQALLAM